MAAASARRPTDLLRREEAREVAAFGYVARRSMQQRVVAIATNERRDEWRGGEIMLR